RNTRLRKKEYVSKLKQLVQELSATKEREDSERRLCDTRSAETRELRKQVVQLFFHYRCVGERDRARWAVIVDETVTLTLPITPYRSFRRSEIVNNSRVLFG
ncbi:unnamed protein product, partial [Phaeothamnion confervicola]